MRIAARTILTFAWLCTLGMATAKAQEGEVVDTWVDDGGDAQDGSGEENGEQSADNGDESDGESAVAHAGDTDASDEASNAGTDTPDQPTLDLLILPILLSESINPVVGHHVSATAIEFFVDAGYTVVSVDRMELAIEQTRTPARPSSAELWNVMFAADADRAAFFFVTARDGQYFIELRAASADGAGPFSGEVAATSSTLRESVEALCERVLPAKESFNHDEADAIRSRAQTVYDFEDSVGQPEPVARPVPATSAFASPPRPERGRLFELALTTQAAFGIGDEFFYNHLIGVRAGVRLTRMWALLLEFSYANLNGRDEREHSVLPILSAQVRFTLSRRFPISLPVRFGLGYLFFNGPVVRASAGLNYAISDRFEVGLDIIAPIVWFRSDQETLASMTVGLEAIMRL